MLKYTFGISKTGFCYAFDLQVNYMPYWWFHFQNEIPITCLFTNWKCTYILDFRTWRWSALNMGFMDKRPSRMHGQCFFRSWAGRTTVLSWVQKISKTLWEPSPTPISLSLQVRKGYSLASAAKWSVMNRWKAHDMKLQESKIGPPDNNTCLKVHVYIGF